MWSAVNHTFNTYRNSHVHSFLYFRTMKLILFCLFSVLACFQGHPTNLFQRGKLSKLYHLAKNGDKVEMDLTHLTIGEDKLRTEGKEEPGNILKLKSNVT